MAHTKVNTQITTKVHKLLFILVLALGLSSCSIHDKKVDDAVIAAYDACEDKTKCVIDFKSSLKFNWDAMHVISNSISTGRISQAIGPSYNKRRGNYLIIFTKNNKIVYQQSNSDILKDQYSNLVFFTPEHISPIPKNNAKFRIKKEKGYFKLAPL